VTDRRIIGKPWVLVAAGTKHTQVFAVLQLKYLKRVVRQDYFALAIRRREQTLFLLKQDSWAPCRIGDEVRGYQTNVCGLR